MGKNKYNSGNYNYKGMMNIIQEKSRSVMRLRNEKKKVEWEAKRYKNNYEYLVNTLEHLTIGDRIKLVFRGYKCLL